MKTLKTMLIILSWIGIPAVIWLGFLTNWKVAVAITLMMWANNLMLVARNEKS